MPPSLSSQPSMAIRIIFLISLAPILINKTTATKTIINEISGNHFVEVDTLFFKYPATMAENFNAAARPIIKAIKENIPRINPLLKPLNMAKIITITKAVSIIM